MLILIQLQYCQFYLLQVSLTIKLYHIKVFCSIEIHGNFTIGLKRGREENSFTRNTPCELKFILFIWIISVHIVHIWTISYNHIWTISYNHISDNSYLNYFCSFCSYLFNSYQIWIISCSYSQTERAFLFCFKTYSTK